MKGRGREKPVLKTYLLGGMTEEEEKSKNKYFNVSAIKKLCCFPS